MRIVQPVVKTVGSFSQGVRDMGRLREVAVILTRHGLGPATEMFREKAASQPWNGF